MIIWGSKKFRKDQGVTRTPIKCEHCQNEKQWLLVRVWTWFTLFFIPIFPMFIRTYLICPICERGVRVGKNNKEVIMKDVELK